MPKLLLDSHAFYWWLIDERRLTLTARKAIGARSSHILVSAASAYELSYKHSAGKLPGAAELVMNFEMAVERSGFHALAITIDHGRRAGELPDGHGDPFDRILAAQSILEDAPIVSNDEKLSALGARRVW